MTEPNLLQIGGEDAGVVHLKGIAEYGHATFCGYRDDFVGNPDVVSRSEPS